MKIYLFFTLFIFSIIPAFSQKIPLTEEILVTSNGKLISTDSLNTGIWVFLISTYECGYCIKDIPYNNYLIEKYKGKINFITLFELDTIKIKNFELKNKMKLEWEKIPNAANIYERHWRFGAFPEYIVYKNGSKRRVFSDASLKTKMKLEKYLSKN